MKTQTATGNAQGRGGLVTSPHVLASEIGRDALARGANAIEAAIAMAAALCVTMPHFTGLGGDGFWLVVDAGGVDSISGVGQAARALPAFEGAIPVRGPRSTLTTAATVAAWEAAYRISRERWGGTQTWEALLAPAVALADEGFPLSSSQHFWLTYRAGDYDDAWSGFARTFLPGGVIPAVGAAFRQPELAASLRLLAANGPRDFYEGALARRIAQGLREAGSPLVADDFAATRVRTERPLTMRYGEGLLATLPPPTQGVTTLQIMGVLAKLGVGDHPHGDAAYYHRLVEAVKQAFMDRDRYLADPDEHDVPVETLLGEAHLAACAARIEPQRALPWPHRFQAGDTVYLGAADAKGRAVSVLQTIFHDWGSGVVAGDTGILWHNRGAAFRAAGGAPHPNTIAPGKRPFHTLNPGMYLIDGRPRLLYGTQGADGQPQTLCALLTRLIDFGMDPLEALAQPRFLLGRTFSDSRDTLKLEAPAGRAVFDGLAARGHEIAELPPLSPLAGQAGVIRLDADGAACGAHDPRSDGLALAV